MAGRMLGLAITMALTAACGGGGSGLPTAPGLPTPVPLSLPDGTYTLTIYSSGLSCTTMSMGGGAPVLATVSGDVQVLGEGGTWRLATVSTAGGTMTGTLTRTVAGVSGTLDGTFVDTGIGVVLEHHAVSGSSSAAGSGLVGGVAGAITYVGTSGMTSCSGNAWNLLPK